MDWQPQTQPLDQLVGVLRDSLSGHDVNAQRNAEQMIKQAKTSPDINNYLTFITVQPTANVSLDAKAYQSARTAAAILLKNNIRSSYSGISEISKTYVKGHIIQGLRDANSIIRSYAGNVITEIVKQGGVLDWPQILPELVSIVEDAATTPEARDGALSAIFKTCEDNRRALDKEYHTQRPLAYLLPKLVSFTQHTDPKVRSRALAAINVFLTQPIALTVKENVDQILAKYVALASDSSEEVRRYVCRAFALLAEGLPTVLVPHVQGIVEFTLIQQKSQNNELQLDAAEFFFEASTKPALKDLLAPFLPQIVPVLLDCMIYSEEDQIRLEGDEDDADTEDQEQDIRPQFATSKRNQLDQPAAIQEYAYDTDDLSEGEIEEDDDEYGDPEDEWNLRKCSAAALDSLALHFGGPVFELTLPWLMENLQHQDWPNREAAVLALGAVGPGTIDSVRPHLPQLVPYIITQLKDDQPVVRQISCWTLSRFASWASQLPPDGKREFFEPMMDGILQKMLDHNKKVQESAASAFATVEEAANTEIIAYCKVIVQQFVKCFARYKDRNIFILYDCVQTLAEHAGPHLAEPELVELLMPALITRWQKVQDSSRELFPLLECLSFVATALSTRFAPFAEPFFDRCIRIIHQNLTESMTAASNPYLDAPDKDFLVTSLDLLSAIIQSLTKPESTALVSRSQTNMFELLAYCMKDDNNDVKQSAYALLGDCAIYVFEQLRPYLTTLMELIIGQLDLQQTSEDPEKLYRVINNSCWSCGEISMKASAETMAQYVDRLLAKFGSILLSDAAPQALKENAAIALGRLGITCHQQLAPHLANFAPAFLHSMQQVSWTDEKGHAYRGFAQVVLDNPQALESCLLQLFMEIAGPPKVLFESMRDDGPHDQFEALLRTYKTMIGAEFDAFLQNLPQTEQHNLRVLYTF